MFDARTRRGSQQSLNGFGTGLAGRGRDLNEAIAELRPLLRDLEPVAAQPGRPARPSSPGSSGRSAATAAEVAPVAEDAGRAVREPGHHVHRARRRRAPVPPGVHLREPADARHGDRASSRASARSCATAPRFFRELRPGRRHAARVRAGAGRRARDRHAHAAQDAGAEPPAGERVRLAGRVRRGPAGAARHPPAARHGRARCSPTIAFLTPAQTTCNYVTLLLPQRGEPALRGRLQRHLAALHHHRGARRARTTRAAPPARPATARSANNFLHVNPYPNTASPGQTKECEAGQRGLRARAAGASATCRGNQGTVTAGQPKREDDE